MAIVADVLETIWIGRSSRHIVQVSEVEGTLPACDEVTRRTGDGHRYRLRGDLGLGRQARRRQLWAVKLEHVVASMRFLEA
jgi:hypothetical protein